MSDSHKENVALVIYDFEKSGHAHRVRLMAGLLGLSVVLQDVDLLAGEQKTEAFLKLNPFGQVPILDDGGDIIWDSTAILVYLAKKYGDESVTLPFIDQISVEFSLFNCSYIFGGKSLSDS